MAAADWFAATAVAAPAPRPRTRPAATPAPAPRRRAERRSSRRHVTGGVLWITVFGVLLAGVVALNVAVLRAHVDVNKLNQQQAQLRQENAALASQVSSASATLRIESAARGFGLVQAAPSDTSYLDLGAR